MSEPELYEVTITICEPCLVGVGGECHSPGCDFFICPALNFEQAARVAGRLGERTERT